jgi:hypothetical protein
LIGVFLFFVRLELGVCAPLGDLIADPQRGEEPSKRLCINTSQLEECVPCPTYFFLQEGLLGITTYLGLLARDLSMVIYLVAFLPFVRQL